jgi:hypothetical protein
MFRHRGAIVRECSEQKSTSPTRQSRYYVSFIWVINLLKPSGNFT